MDENNFEILRLRDEALRMKEAPVLSDLIKETVPEEKKQEIEDCKHYLAGYCKYGNKCFKRHPK